MGSEVCRAVLADPDLVLVAAVDVTMPTGLPTDVACGTTPAVMEAAGVDVAVDFTVAASAAANAHWCAAHGVHAVVGTSGLSPSDIDGLRSVFDGARSNCLVAPNFAIGAVLMIRFATLAAPFFETAEIIELHHDGKADAPSGTAIHTAAQMAAASSMWAPDPTKTETLPSARAALGDGGIRIHSVRMRGMVAHQEVIMGTTGQTLTLRHDSYDRTSFMPGVLLAIHRVADHPGLSVGLDAYLDL
jgi:4-hydroxy-tetrahydrodipicolinate reductase